MFDIIKEKLSFNGECGTPANRLFRRLFHFWLEWVVVVVAVVTMDAPCTEEAGAGNSGEAQDRLVIVGLCPFHLPAFTVFVGATLLSGD